MKKQLATLLLLCYTFVWLSPLAPVVSDWLAHTFWLSEHVATVHYENGSYHVHYEIKEISKETQHATPQNAPQKSANETVQVHISATASELPVLQHTTTVFIPQLNGIIQHIFRTVPSPPPWC
jgi:hypothetical protein